MVQNSVRGKGERTRVRQAAELGWNDSQYEENGGAVQKGDDDASSEPHAHGRHGSGGGKGRGYGGGGGTHPPRRRRVLRWSASVLAVVILGTAGAGYLYYQHLNSNIRKGERSSGDSKAAKAQPNSDGQTPINILLIGSDSRNSDANVALGGSRENRGSPPLGDVQMLIHLSADRKSAAVVSIPRDTRVEIPKCKDPDTGTKYGETNRIINESLARGGAGCTLATWQNLTNVYIDHWMTIDFAGVVKMADAIGGVDVCVKQNVWDRPKPGVPGGSGLKLTEGTHKVKGEQALQWLRTRHAFESDLGRAKAQHMYMNSMIRTLREQNVFTDTGRLMALAEAATKSLTVSKEIGTVKKLYDLGMQLKTVPTNRITMLTMPTVQDPQNKEHLIPAPGEADKMWEMIRDDVPFDKSGASSEQKSTTPGKAQASKTPADPDDQIGVIVQNGTRSSTLAPVSGRASAVAQVLAGKGFAKAQTDSTTAPAEAKTVVRYPSAELEGDAQRVANALGIPLTSVKKSTDVSGVTLVVGADWRSGTAYPKQSTPKAGYVPEGADAINGSETGCMPVYSPYRW
ncbi:LCP family protein [Streptomyces yaanensis]|uniref:LCP family protein n=1 Tax=Streptomyces yaanensis TaxID=1142239 RepID=A0ABV7S8D5_9ACTN|nr:LCP family protein [Streptomyces sp. CGMCC 4.7035]WNC02262.1 LCP family protein [Streptomyces sp. CGMCC 4.7035]